MTQGIVPTETKPPEAKFTIVFAIWPGMTHLDFTGPHQFLSRTPNSQTIVASPAGGAVEADGLVFANTVRIADVRSCDLICVPGGVGATKVAQDAAFIGELRRLASGARYITSVCTGSLILGAAGLLKGKRAACHWAYAELLPLFGAIHDSGRVVRDGNIITGGGEYAGQDGFGWTNGVLLALIKKYGAGD
jgi:putative intracellular protease/amidase